jgi:hypothetical protein
MSTPSWHGPDGQKPDFVMRTLIKKQLSLHPWPIFNKEGVRVACLCGWESADSNKQSNRNKFRAHLATVIEHAITAELIEVAA